MKTMNKIKKQAIIAVAGVCASGLAFANAIVMNSTSFSHVETFDSLGTSDVAWDDGNTIEGVYLDSAAAGIPATVPDSIGDNSTPGVYNMGLAGDSDRALGYLTGSTTGTGYTGVQFKNLTGVDGLEISYSFVLEQWGARNTSAQDFILQYKVHSSGGNENILNSTSWNTLGTAYTPVVNGSSPYELNGNENQFAISGTKTIAINNGQYLSFRLYDRNHSGGDAMVGIDSISVSVIPEPATLGLMGFGVIGALIARRLKI